MKCLYCQGSMTKGTAPFHIDRRGVHVTLEAVPAWVCSQCGEPFFEEQEVDAIQDLINSVDEKSEPFAASA